MIVPHCNFIAMNHVFDESTLAHLEADKKKIIIKDHVWIGFGVTIFAGVVVGEWSIVEVWTVVTKAVEPYSIFGGVPAKKIKDRRKINEKENNACFWHETRSN